MSVGSTIVDIVTVTLPVAGTLAGGYLVQRTEAKKRAHESKSAGEAETRRRLDADRANEERLIATVLSAGATWRAVMMDAISQMRLYERRVPDAEMAGKIADAQRAFGDSVNAGTVYLTEKWLTGDLYELFRIYNSGFEIMQDILSADRNAPVPATAKLFDLQHKLGVHLSSFSLDARSHLSPPAARLGGLSEEIVAPPS